MSALPPQRPGQRGLVGVVRMLAHRRPLVVRGRDHRAHIMARAVAAARLHQYLHGGTWAEAMSLGLTAAWRAARAARPVVTVQ